MGEGQQAHPGPYLLQPLRADAGGGEPAADARQGFDPVVDLGPFKRTSGGGGLGPPEARERDLVVADVRSARVTRDGAARDYGLVLDQ